MEYIWLIILWLLFGLLHSMFAATRFKEGIRAGMKGGYKYYRILYSCFAVANLAAILWYHYNIDSDALWNNTTAEKMIAIILAVPAVAIMAISIKKYFMDLSGIDAFIQRRAIKPQHLETGGLHRFVRHPLYFGTLLFVWCIFLWQPTISNIISSACLTVYTLVGTWFEEKKLVQMFGEEYVAYTKKVPMIVPGW